MAGEVEGRVVPILPPVVRLLIALVAAPAAAADPVPAADPVAASAPAAPPEDPSVLVERVRPSVVTLQTQDLFGRR